MFSKKYRIGEPHGIYFLTFTVIYWIDLFTRSVYKELLIKTLEFYRNERGLRVFAFVIMPNHMHLILQSPDEPLSDIIRDYKKWTSRKAIELIQSEPESRRKWLLNLFGWAGKHNPLNTHFQLWTNDNHPIVLYSRKFYEQKRQYIHQNPVRARIVHKAEDYVFSSASNYAGLGGVMKVSFLDELGGVG